VRFVCLLGNQPAVVLAHVTRAALCAGTTVLFGCSSRSMCCEAQLQQARHDTVCCAWRAGARRLAHLPAPPLHGTALRTLPQACHRCWFRAVSKTSVYVSLDYLISYASALAVRVEWYLTSWVRGFWMLSIPCGLACPSFSQTGCWVSWCAPTPLLPSCAASPTAPIAL